ncbi:hypothetical protein BT63DRAFT_459482 [Microthyrium microscopicum]|uniref:Uncharacterized protein n=1 Tax=Microthyrium microscopicum TaxID=703497 RepID=A0A6A6TZM0_9PEZI|nr:hypothetical protein BT63DRAFT_459482 [Microthyrium microscopicum]
MSTQPSSALPAPTASAAPTTVKISSSQDKQTTTLFIDHSRFSSAPSDAPAVLTVWTPVKDCFSNGFYYGSDFGTTTSGFTPTLVLFPTQVTGRQSMSGAWCFPYQNTGQFYSPAVCPSGYTTATAQVMIDTLLGSTQYIATCCPSSLTLSQQGCTGMTDRTSILSWYPSYTVPLSPFSRTTPYITEIWLDLFVSSPVTVGLSAPAFIAYWQNTDVQIMRLLNITSSSSTTITRSQSSPLVSSTPKASFGDQAGPIAGVVVGALAILAAVCGLVWVLLFYRRRRKNPRSPTSNEESDGWGKAELGGEDVSRFEKDAASYHEFPGPAIPPTELLGSVPEPQELGNHGRASLDQARSATTSLPVEETDNTIHIVR